MINNNYFTPKEMGLTIDCTWDQINAFEDLVIHTLNPLREAYGKPIKVNSGYRSQEHNKAVGGSKTSQHMALGAWAAADITAGSISENKKLIDLIRTKKIPHDQLILEHGGLWLHLSYRTDTKNRFQYLEIG
jgi:hypothetical protein